MSSDARDAYIAGKSGSTTYTPSSTSDGTDAASAFAAGVASTQSDKPEIFQNTVSQQDDGSFVVDKNPLQQQLDNFVRYVSRLASGEDVGGAMAGGAQRSKLAESIFNPMTLVDVGVTTLRYEVLAALLAKGVKASELEEILDLGSSTSFAAVNIAINNLAKSYGIDIDTEYQYEENLSENEMRKINNSSMGSSDTGGKPQFPPSQTIRTENEAASASQVPIELLNQIANNSTLANANVINPNTMAAGQSVFGQDDPVFSGIMSTNVGKQRVA